MRLALLALTGCNQIFGLHVPAPIPDAPDAAPPTCVNTNAVYDTFDEPTGTKPCSSWGYDEQANCTTAIANSQLVMTPDPNALDVSRCGCGALSAIAFTPQSGTFVYVAAVGTGPKEYTVFSADWEGAGESSAIVYGGGVLNFSRGATTFGTLPYNDASRWWRIRPTSDGAIVGEASPDGATWTAIGTDVTMPPAQIRTHFVMGTFAPEPTSTTAAIDNVNVCP